MRTLVTADIHGSYKALIQCLKLSKFNYNKDRLIVLGDICDSYPDTPKIVDELLKIKNRIDIKGNHDNFLLETLSSGVCAPIHYKQGGKATMESYNYNVPKIHHDYFLNLIPYFIDEHNNFYVHGGIPVNKLKYHIKQAYAYDLMWDRSLIYRARNIHNVYIKSKLDINKGYKLIKYNKLFCGHTTIESFTDDFLPQKFLNLWALDTGCGWSGKLTIMDTETEEYWQSDFSRDLYPEHEINKK